MSEIKRLIEETTTQMGLPDTSHFLRICCPAPGIRNHNGTAKPVVTLTRNGFWAYCRWSREMEFIAKEQCREFWSEEEKSEPQRDPRAGDEVVVRVPARLLAQTGKSSWMVEVMG